MLKTIAVLTMPFLLAADLPQAAIKVDRTCYAYADSHTLVRNDVLGKLQTANQNLPLCESILDQAQEDLTSAKEQLLQAEKDLKALHEAAMEQRAVIAELKAQNAVLNEHITKLEALTCPEPTIGDQFVRGWEEVDATVSLASGYAVGVGMCVGLAWVFNQPALTR